MYYMYAAPKCLHGPRLRLEASASATVNLADPWWVQSDGGDFATAGSGWVRVFGKSLSFGDAGAPETRSPAARRRTDDAERVLDSRGPWSHEFRRCLAYFISDAL
jgi:hypothetical protein